MMPAVNFGDVCTSVAWKAVPRDRRKVVMVGLLFARPSFRLTEEQILPNLQYFHHRSGHHFHFFCAGYTPYGGEIDDYHEVGLPGWVYSDRMFNMLRSQIEAKSRWRYSGEVELLLTNAHIAPRKRTARLDLRSTIVCNLDEMSRKHAFDSLPQFFERIFQFAETANGEDPTWGFSDTQGISAASMALKRVVLKALPRELGRDVERVAHFAVRDCGSSRKSQWWRFWRQ